jgi:ATP-binding cassette subfamily B protein
MTLFIVLPIILIIVWGLLVEKVMAKLWNTRQSVFDNLYDYCEETFTGIRVIKAFLKESMQLLHFSKIAKKNKESDIKLGVAHVAFDVVIIVLIEGIISLIIGLGGWFVYLTASGKPWHIFGTTVNLTTSELVTFLNYFIILIWPLIALGSVITMHARAKTSYKRIARFMDAEENIKDKENAIELTDVKGKIEFKNLSFAYKDDKNPTLKGISLVINPGEKIGVVGRVGSGKSTLVSLLTRLYNVDEGTLFFDDKDVMECTVKSVREAVAAVPQDNFLFSLSIKENIEFGRDGASFEDVKHAAEFSDVAKDVEGFEKKYDSLTGERGLSLSGGQKQRISISRAFIKNAPIMILDDSVSAVDIDTEEKILENISKERDGKTTIIISSRVSTVNKLDKIIVLNEGELEAFDSPSNLVNISPTYKKMVELQKLEDEIKEANYGRH